MATCAQSGYSKPIDTESFPGTAAISAGEFLRGLPGQDGDVDGAGQSRAASALDGQVDPVETEVMRREQVQRVLARGDALDGQLD